MLQARCLERYFSEITGCISGTWYQRQRSQRARSIGIPTRSQRFRNLVAASQRREHP